MSDSSNTPAPRTGFRLRHKPTKHLMAQPYVTKTEAELSAIFAHPLIACDLEAVPVTLPCGCGAPFVRNVQGTMVCAKCGAVPDEVRP